MEENREVKPVRRRRHSAAFKAEAIRACMQPGISVASAALQYRLNANLLRRWVADHETQAPDAVTPAGQTMPIQPAGFVPLQLNRLCRVKQFFSKNDVDFIEQFLLEIA